MVPFSHSLDFPAIGCIHNLEFTATGYRSFLYLFRLLALFSWIGSFLVPVCQRCPIPLRRVFLVAVCQPNFSLLVAVCRIVLDQLCVSSRSRLTFVLSNCIPSPSHATKTPVSGVVTSISPPVVDVKSWYMVRRLLHHSRRLDGDADTEFEDVDLDEDETPTRVPSQPSPLPQPPLDMLTSPLPTQMQWPADSGAKGTHKTNYSDSKNFSRVSFSVKCEQHVHDESEAFVPGTPRARARRCKSPIRS